jgi:hypothetical protein
MSTVSTINTMSAMTDKLMDLAIATHEQFAAMLNDDFVVLASEKPLALRLTHVRANHAHKLRQSAGFSLTFVGPSTPILAQQIVALRHVTLGTMEIFLVPVARDESATTYEAVFN